MEAPRQSGWPRCQLVQVGACARREVGRAARERLAVEGGVLEQHEADAVRHVQPLVPVDGQRVGALEPGDELRRRLPEPEERAERSVGVQPQTVLLADVGDGLDRVEAPVLTEPTIAITIAGSTPLARSRSIASASRSTRIA